MKKTIATLVFILLCTNIIAQDIEPAPPDKAVVYFVRAVSMGFAINFTYFDRNKLIGKFNGPKYTRYECEPGEHLFWARSENRDFVEANVEAGKVYIIDVIPKMGGFKAAVRLVPVDPTTYNMKKIMKLLGKKKPVSFTDEELKKTEVEMAEVIARGLEKYEELKSEGKEVKVLTPEMVFDTSQ